MSTQPATHSMAAPNPEVEGSRRDEMDDAIYLALGIAVFAAFIGYAALLKKA
jgi:hypothetical protein